MAATRLPVVCLFGAADIQLRSSQDAPEHETTALDCHCFPSDAELQAVLIRYDPHVLITIGRDAADFPRLMAAPFEVRRRWLHYPDALDLARIGSEAFHCYLAVCLDHRPEMPLVSIFTPTFRTGETRFARTFASVLAQHYDNWEWVLWDDSDDDGLTHAMLREYAGRDHRLRVIRPERHSGVIGAVKHDACMACRGDILVELDHDDELLPDALAQVVEAAGQHPDCGFFYSDFAEVGPNLEPLRYPDGWGYGYGSYREEVVRGVTLAVAQAPNINAKTIRGLVAAPNHLRAWRRETYLQLGGHNRYLHVADDMELMVRTFLATTMVRVPRLLYLQYQEGGNTQRVRNKDIQRHVRYLRSKYDRRIHDRFVELGVDDWIWDEARGFGDMDRPNPAVEPVASVVAGEASRPVAPAVTEPTTVTAAVSAPSIRQTICLSMIVKNEAPVIARCLASVRPFITHWVVVDTGSSDGTQDIVREAMRDLPGKLHERPWRDFAHNRTEALELARPHGAYVLVIDADDTLEADPGFELPQLKADSYLLRITDGKVAYERRQLVRTALEWSWRGVLHEFLYCEAAKTSARLNGLLMRRNHDGARRRDPNTYRRDAAILEAAIQEESDPFLLARYRFYLAQSYRDSGERAKAVEHYLARAELGYWDEERFVSLLNAARLMTGLGRPFEEVLATYERASAACPRRAEALHGASMLCAQHKRHRQGYDIAARGLGLALPTGGLFVEPWIYEYGLLDAYTANAYLAGEHKECLNACLRLLGGGTLPMDKRGTVAANARLALEKLSAAPSPASRDTASLARQHALGPARPLRTRLPVPPPRVLVAILAKQKEPYLPLYLQCIEALDYPKSAIVLYVRTNNNTDGTERVLREWLDRVGHLYAGVEMDAEDVPERVQDYGVHEWNPIRFAVLGRIRNRSMQKALDYDCEFYFTADVDNYVRSCTICELVALDLPIVAPFLRAIAPSARYSNFHSDIDAKGYSVTTERYSWAVERRLQGVVEMPVVHCTYLVRSDVIPELTYEDGTDRYEYVVFSDSARRAGIPQYLDNRQVYGYITFEEGSENTRKYLSPTITGQVELARGLLNGGERGAVPPQLSLDEDGRRPAPESGRAGLRAYVINLDRSADRLAEFRSRNAHLRDVSRFPGVDGRLLSREKLVADGTILGGFPGTMGTIGSFLSHSKLWKLSVESNEALTIFEDDSITSHRFDEESQSLLLGLGENWDMIVWGWNFDAQIRLDLFPGLSPVVIETLQDRMRSNVERFQTAIYHRKLFKLFQFFGNHCYSISPRGAKALLEYCMPFRSAVVDLPDYGQRMRTMSVDGLMTGIVPKMRAFVCMPPLAVSMNDHASSLNKHP